MHDEDARSPGITRFRMCFGACSILWLAQAQLALGYLAIEITGSSFIIQSAHKGAPPEFDITSPAYGALCNGTGDDSKAISAASLAASKYYAETGSQAVVLIPKGGNGKCLITHAITYYSGTHFLGSGGTIVNSTSSAYSFANAHPGDGDDAIWFDHIRIIQTTSGSLPGIAYVGGEKAGSGGTHHQFWITDSDIKGSGYAVKVNIFYQDDKIRHTLDDVVIRRNHIWCDLVSGSYDTACRDGININGDLTDFIIESNNIEQRDDAAIAFTSSGGSSPSGHPGLLQYLTPTRGTVSNNVTRNVGSGLDFSGGNTIKAVNNSCIDSLPNPHSSPCIRFIRDFYPLPSNITVSGGVYRNMPTGTDQANVKMDFAGTAVHGSYPVCSCSISGAEIGGFIYMLGNGFQLNNNKFDSGTRFTISVENGNATNAIRLRNNTWLGSRTITLTSINGGITNSSATNDLYNGKRSNRQFVPEHSGIR